MEQKHNFNGIIISVISAVILLTVIPIINGINEEHPPCEEIPSYNIGNVNVNPDFSSGNFIVDKGSYDYLDNVTIVKDNNLIPENIKKGVNIFGIIGTFESEEELPFSYSGMGIVFVSGLHNNYNSPSIEILPPEARFLCNDGTNDLYIDGTLISFKAGTEWEEINYSFIFLIPTNYVLKRFELKSNIDWWRQTNTATALVFSSTSEVTTKELSIDNGHTTPNQFTNMFSFTSSFKLFREDNFVNVMIATRA